MKLGAQVQRHASAFLPDDDRAKLVKLRAKHGTLRVAAMLSIGHVTVENALNRGRVSQKTVATIRAQLHRLEAT